MALRAGWRAVPRVDARGRGNNERSLWNLAAAYGKTEFVDEMRFWHNLRMELLPYLYSVALDCAEASRLMMRPRWSISGRKIRWYGTAKMNSFWVTVCWWRRC